MCAASFHDSTTCDGAVKTKAALEGLASNTDLQKRLGGPVALLANPTLNQRRHGNVGRAAALPANSHIDHVFIHFSLP